MLETYEQYFDSLKDGEIAMTPYEYAQALAPNPRAWNGNSGGAGHGASDEGLNPLYSK